MKALQSLLLGALLVLSPAASQAQDTGVPDSLIFGDNGKAYGYPGGNYRVPVYLVSDRSLFGVSFGVEYGLSLSGQVYDSVSEFGSLFQLTNFFDLGGVLINTNSIHSPNPDTVGLGAAANLYPMLPGRYKFCDVFFHGANLGQQISLDTTFFLPAGNVTFFDDAFSQYAPRFVAPTLTVEPSFPEFVVVTPSTATGNAGSEFFFQAGVASRYPPEVVSLDSVVNTATHEALANLPPHTGTNPLVVSWTPTYSQYGSWFAYFTAIDAHANPFHFQVLVIVNYVEPPCQALRGDPNCDNQIDISDVVFLIQYIFANGPAPGCAPR